MKENNKKKSLSIEYRMYVYKNKIQRIKKQFHNYFPQILRQNNSSVKEKYAKTYLLNIEEAYTKIELLVNSNTPFLIGRYGESELKMVRCYLERKYMGKSKEYEAAKRQLCVNAGFFPENTRYTDKFAEVMIELSKEIDLLGIWNNDMEDYVCAKFATSAEFMKLRNLEPYYGIDKIRPWTIALKGKKVLVIHPFIESIRYQYGRRELIWGDKDILPEFELHTIKAVQTIAGQLDDRFDTWFEALDYMIEQCKKEDFDIALVGCGAYGLPLAAEIKKMGKGAIHIGGALQILFGIKGKRWDNHSYISSLYNEYWIRPMEKERPKDIEKVEEGCYW